LRQLLRSLYLPTTLGLTKVREVFYGNLNFLARFLTLNMEFVESFFNIPQYPTFKILLAAICTLETGHIIYNKKFAIVPVNVLRLARPEFFMTTESTPCFHDGPHLTEIARYTHILSSNEFFRGYTRLLQNVG